MLCEKCKKRTATVFYNENVNGKMRAFSLCGECAAALREQGELQDITSMVGSFADPFSELQDNLFGGFFGVSNALGASVDKKRCPKCSSTYAEIAHVGRVGCPECYTVFADELSRTIRSMHGTTSHTGSVPARQRARQEREEQIKKLREQMQDAIKKEDFERAATIRDEIRRASEETDGKDSNGGKEEN